MALSGIVLLGYVLAHMVGNLKVFLGATHRQYAEWLRDARRARPSPHDGCSGRCASACIAAFVLHIVAAAQLTRMNQRARADAALPVAPRLRGRELRVPHDAVDRRHRRPVRRLPPARPHVGTGQPRTSCAATCTTTSSRASSGCRWRSSTSSPTSRSAFHIFHGAWSMFQSLGLNNPRFNMLAALLRRRVRGGHRRRQHQHAAARRDRGGAETEHG